MVNYVETFGRILTSTYQYLVALKRPFLKILLIDIFKEFRLMSVADNMPITNRIKKQTDWKQS